MLKGTDYLITVDYFSRYPEVTQLRTTTSSTVINSLKSIFARHGIPETVRSDNGPQFASSELVDDFARNYQFRHTTSSPHFPSSNGQAERAVKQVKHLLKRADDPFLALLSYRSTPMSMVMGNLQRATCCISVGVAQVLVVVQLFLLTPEGVCTM